MRKKGGIVRYTAEEIDAMLARGESKTDWKKVAAMPQEEVERMADEDDGPLPEGWEKMVVKGLVGLPPDVIDNLRKKDIHIRLDAYVVDWFKQQGSRGYQTRINSVLRAFIAAQHGRKERAGSSSTAYKKRTVRQDSRKRRA